MVTDYVRFDEHEDAVAALELVAAAIIDVAESPSRWKWIVMGAHNALQAAMVVALAGTDECGALTAKSMERNRAWLESLEGDQPKVYMADFVTLLHRVQQSELMEGPPLEISAEQTELLERLNRLRRQFAHFNPQGWSIETKLLLQVVPLTLNAIEHLLTTQDRVQIHMSEEQKDRVARSLSTSRDVLATL